jgi:Protein of unknown function (DUF3108)
MFANRSRKSFQQALAVYFAVALLGSAAGTAIAQRQAATKQLPFQPGEELVYQAELSKGLLRGVDVAEFRLKINEPRNTPQDSSADDPANAFLLTADVVSKGFFVRLFGLRFRQQIESTVDRSGFTALRTKKLDEQNKRVRSSEAVFDHEVRNVTWTERDPNNPSQAPRVVSAEFTEPVQDVLSAVYFLRTQQLEVGKLFEIQISDSGRVARIPVNVVERKRMKTALGTVNALRVEAALFGERGMVRGDGRFSVWITDDNRRLPVRAQVKVDAGTFNIKLKRVTNSATALKH